MKNFAFIKPVFLKDLVRVGNPNDGGYVINERCIKNTDFLVGLGINADWSFESDFLKRKPSVKLFCFDFSVSGLKFLKNALQSFFWPAQSFYWLKTMVKFSMFFRGNRKFFKKGVTDYSKEYYIRFGDVISIIGESNLKENSIFLKIDIEQSEFRIMDEVAAYSKFINGIAIEFHDIDTRWETFRETIALLSNDFIITHVHGNNYGETFTPRAFPRTFEITFVRKTLVGENELSFPDREVRYPIEGLDAPNDPAKPDFVLDFSE